MDHFLNFIEKFFFVFVNRIVVDNVNLIKVRCLFKVFYKAKEMLPGGTTLAINYSELSLYNYGAFNLKPIYTKADHSYEIDGKCKDSWELLYKSNQIYLCKKIKI